MKSNSSANTKTTAKKNPKKPEKKAPLRAKRSAPATVNEPGPFQGLDPQTAALLPALISAIEKDLTMKGLTPSICHRSLPAGLAYYFSVSHAVSLEIGVTRPKAGSDLRFWIDATFGHALRGAKRVHLLETLLEINAEASFPIYLGLTQGSHIQAQYSARVHDQLTIASVGETIDRVIGFAMWVREKLNNQTEFAPLSFKGNPEGSDTPSESETEETPEEEPSTSETQGNDSPGPNGWVH